MQTGPDSGTDKVKKGGSYLCNKVSRLCIAMQTAFQFLFLLDVGLMTMFIFDKSTLLNNLLSAQKISPYSSPLNIFYCYYSPIVIGIDVQRGVRILQIAQLGTLEFGVPAQPCQNTTNNN